MTKPPDQGGSARILTASALFATWVIWGSTYLGIKLALPWLPPFLQMGSRFIAAGALLLLIAQYRGARFPSGREWRAAFVVGTLLLAGGAGGTALAEQTVASGLAAAFIASEPALILLLGLTFQQKPTRQEIVGIGVGLTGVVLLSRGSGFSASATGAAAMAVAAVSWSIGSVLATHVLRPASGMAGAGSQMLCGGGVLLIGSWLQREPLRWPPPAQALAAWSYLVVFGSIVAFTAFYYLLAHARTSLAMSYTYVNPVVALMLGYAFAGERFSYAELLAAAVIAVGVVLLLPNRST